MGDACQAPEGVSDGLHEFALAEAAGLIFVPEGGEVAFVIGGIFGGEEDGTAGQARFHGRQGSRGWFAIVSGI